jgi:hypothetical protein
MTAYRCSMRRGGAAPATLLREAALRLTSPPNDGRASSSAVRLFAEPLALRCAARDAPRRARARARVARRAGAGLPRR